MRKTLPQLDQEALRRAYVAAFRWLGDADESHDACQEAARRALDKAHRYDRRRPFYPWFYRILMNHCLDRLAGRKRRADAAALLGNDTARRATAEDDALAAERARAILQAIDELPDDLREMIELRHFQDLSYEEMAYAVQRPLGTIMSRLYRARKRLREILVERHGDAWRGGAA